MSLPLVTPIAILDANVLFPMALCDTLMRAALEGAYRARWNQTILDEIARNLVIQGRATPEGARRRCMNMQRALPDATVTGYEARLPLAKNDPKDRHVLATALHVGARVIVTHNRRHFPAHALAPYGIEAQSADTFLNYLLVADPATMERAVAEQAARLKSPPQSVEQVLNNLSREAPTFVRAIRERMQQG